jgi:UDP-N-acetylglucosamine 4-epimerase
LARDRQRRLHRTAPALVRAALELEQTVVGLDNFATGRDATSMMHDAVTAERWSHRFIETDTDVDACRSHSGVSASCCIRRRWVRPRSIADPLATNAANVDGFSTCRRGA